MKVLRWILTAPAAIVAYLVCFVVATFLYSLFNGRVEMSLFLIRLTASALSGAAGVGAAIVMAPNKNRIAGIIGAVTITICSLFAILMSVVDYQGGEWRLIVENIVAIIAAIAMCVKYWADGDFD